LRKRDAGRRSKLRIVITSGPTRERIDPVRYLSNYSTGRMGASLAKAALARGHRVTVISGPGSEPLPARTRVIPVEAASDMDAALRRQARQADVIVMAAAVADFRPARPGRVKLPRTRRLTLRLEAVPDLIGRLPRRKPQIVAGFAVESGSVLGRAARKLRAKRLDALVAQRLTPDGAPFGRRPVRAWLLEPCARPRPLGRVSKPAVARALLDKVEELWYRQQGTHES
jgi:phosphopantothenoylcysteine decarboxylase/phosphopantothenate--cysteine ligase